MSFHGQALVDVIRDCSLMLMILVGYLFVTIMTDFLWLFRERVIQIKLDRAILLKITHFIRK